MAIETAKISLQVDFQQIVDAVKQLSPSEKFELSEIIWAGDSDTSIPLETQQLVLDRIKFAEEHPESMLDWEDAKKLLNA